MTVSGPGKRENRPYTFSHRRPGGAGAPLRAEAPGRHPTANAAKQWAFCAPGERSPGHLERHDHDQTD